MPQALPFPHIQRPSFSNNGSKAYLCLAFTDQNMPPVEMCENMKIMDSDALLMAKPKT